MRTAREQGLGGQRQLCVRAVALPCGETVGTGLVSLGTHAASTLPTHITAATYRHHNLSFSLRCVPTTSGFKTHLL